MHPGTITIADAATAVKRRVEPSQNVIPQAVAAEELFVPETLSLG